MVRAIPNTTVIDPMDVTEFQQAMNVAVDTPGLVYAGSPATRLVF